MRRSRSGLLWVALALAACGGNAGGNDQADVVVPAPQAVAPKDAAVRASPFDAEGRLKPSGRMIYWLEIPATFENTASWSKHHVFESKEVPVAKVREYLSARMFTGAVEELGEGALYRNVLPLSAAADAMRFDIQVGLTAGGRVVRIDLDELSFPGVPSLSPEQAAEALKRERKLSD